jgi:hypothetical protein
MNKLIKVRGEHNSVPSKRGKVILSFESRFLWFNPTLKEYIGSGTCWHTFPDFNLCGTFMSEYLYNVWSKLVYNDFKIGDVND